VPLPNVQVPFDLTGTEHFWKWTWLWQDLDLQGGYKSPRKHVSLLQAKFVLSPVRLLLHLTCELRGKISFVKMIQVKDKPQLCTGRRWW